MPEKYGPIKLHSNHNLCNNINIAWEYNLDWVGCGMTRRNWSDDPATVIMIFLALVALLTYAGYLTARSPHTISSTKPNLTNTTNERTYGPWQEFPNMSIADPNITTYYFACNASSDCVPVRTQKCFNNLASQEACISANYSRDYYRAYAICANSIISFRLGSSKSRISLAQWKKVQPSRV